MLDSNNNEPKFYSCRYDAAFKEVFLNDKNRDLLKAIIESVIGEEIIIEKTSNVELLDGNVNVRKKRIDARVKATGKVVEIEVNTETDNEYKPRNVAYIGNIYSKYTFRGDRYDENTDIIQINFSYGISNKEYIREYFIQDKSGNKFVKNFKIYEVNMQKVKETWYNNAERDKFKYLSMMDLSKEELEKIPKGEDVIMDKYKKEIIDKNDDPLFQEFMSREEDERKMFNTKLYNAEEKGRASGIKETAKNMLKDNLDLNTISKYTGLTIKEIETLR